MFSDLDIVIRFQKRYDSHVNQQDIISLPSMGNLCSIGHSVKNKHADLSDQNMERPAKSVSFLKRMLSCSWYESVFLILGRFAMLLSLHRSYTVKNGFIFASRLPYFAVFLILFHFAGDHRSTDLRHFSFDTNISYKRKSQKYTLPNIRIYLHPKIKSVTIKTEF